MKHAAYISLPYHPHDMPIYHQLPAGNCNSHGTPPLDLPRQIIELHGPMTGGDIWKIPATLSSGNLT